MNTQEHDELVVLASMIHPATAAETTKIATSMRLKPRVMFTSNELIEQYLTFRKYGNEAFAEGFLLQQEIADLASANVKPIVARIIANYKRHLMERDRALGEFETPGPDKDDPDCLFQNRWLRKGACGAIVSTSGVGKSTFSIQAATLWAGGQECLGVKPLKPLKIGIFQTEDDEYDIANFRDRIRVGLTEELGWNEAQISDAESRVIFCQLDGTTGLRFVEHFRQKQKKQQFDLVIINPLFAFFGGDLNDGAKVTEFLRQGIDRVIKDEETKCGCLIIHHTAKPNKDAIKSGDVFKAYLGSGSAEFTNYIRSALVLTPWQNGKISGVFDLVAAKHGDKLAWRDSSGKPTIKKRVCYANKLASYQQSGMIFWVEPDEAQLEEIKKEAEKQKPTAVGDGEPPVEKCAKLLAKLIGQAWKRDVKPTSAAAKHGQRAWVEKLARERCGGYVRATKAAAYDLIVSNPGKYGLAFFEPQNAKPYLVSTIQTTPQEDIF